MKLNPNFIKHSMDGQTVLVPMADAPFHGLVQGNKTVGAILDCLSSDVTRDEIVDELSRRYDGDRSIIEADVDDVLEKLKKIGAVDGE